MINGSCEHKITAQKSQNFKVLAFKSSEKQI